MIIINLGHNFQYEIERIVTMFFDAKETKTFYEEIDLEGKDYVKTVLTKGETEDTLYTEISYDGKLKSDKKRIDNSLEEYSKYCERYFAVMIKTILEELTGIKLKWGVLTGIRPVKLIEREKQKGKTEEELRDIFTNQLMVSDQKYDLARRTLDEEEKILSKSSKNSYSLYLSMPFCPTRCHYCSFVSSAIGTKKAKELVPRYVELLCEELKEIAKIANDLNLHLETVYFGGGTPTTMSAPQLKAVMETLNENFPITKETEFTVEAGRPDTIDKDKLTVLKNAGVSRISINPQTLNNEILKEIGRNHTKEQTIESFNLAREVGFDNINMDVIAGLPKETFESFKNTIDEIVSLSPENVTVHTLTIKHNADYAEDKSKVLSEIGEVSKMVDYAQDVLTKEGYVPYYLYRQKNTIGNLENVGFCKKGYEGYYNVYIMDETHTILAAGAGAVTKLKNPNGKEIERIANFKFPFEYNNDFNEIIKRKEKVKEFYGKTTL